MKFKQLLRELREKQCYGQFMQENPDAFLTAGFFVLDDSGNNTFQLDYFIPKIEKIAISSYPFDRFKIQEDEIKKAERLDENINIDICDLKEKVEDIKLKNNYNRNTNKIIAVLKDGKWNLTCFSSSLDILRIFVDCFSGNCDKFEKASLMDFMQVRKTKKD